MAGLIVFCAMLVAVAIDLPYAEMAGGEHYDCLHLEQYAKANHATWDKIADYCNTNPMQDFTKDEYGRQKDWNRY